MNPAGSATNSLERTESIRRRWTRLSTQRELYLHRRQQLTRRLSELDRQLELSGPVTVALERLGDQLFSRLLGIVQTELTRALGEVLEQPIQLRATCEFRRGGASVDFWIERDGHREDVYKGQGGSVANILSVGLRMFALATLDPQQHRRFLVLDEQDCWLRPDLVPRLVKIIHQASHQLGFQILLISHHDVHLFEQYADKIYRLTPNGSGSVDVELVGGNPLSDVAEHEC